MWKIFKKKECTCNKGEVVEKEIVCTGCNGEGKIKTKTFVIPVGKVSAKEAEKSIKELMKSYKDDVELDETTKIPHSKDYFFPTYEYNELNEEQKLHVNMTEDEWKELTTSERKERLLSKEEQNELFGHTGFVDWNNYDLDFFADYLEKKWMFMSSGEAKAIMEMTRFYRRNKNEKNS